MGLEINPITLGRFVDLPDHARHCCFWESYPANAASTTMHSDWEFEKRVWLSHVLLEWGPCGVLAEEGGCTVASGFFAPPKFAVATKWFASGPISADAVVLTGVTLLPSHRRKRAELFSAIIAVMAQELRFRGISAIEAFGRISGDGEVTETGHHSPPLSVSSSDSCSPLQCMLSAEELLQAGFVIKQEDPQFPRLRLELQSDIQWKAAVETALHRLSFEATLRFNGLPNSASQHERAR